MASRLGHQSREAVLREHGKWLARQASEHKARFCETGVCYMGFEKLFECDHEARLDAEFPPTTKEQK